MNCYHPVLMRNPRYLQLSTKIVRSLANPDSFSQDYATDANEEFVITKPYIYAPCRRCPACLKLRSLEWQGRLIREYEYQRSLGKRTLFVTLTYDNVSIKHAMATYKKDIARFFDRMRSKYRRSIRHYVVAELGDKKGRFHCHALLFDAPENLRPVDHFRRTKAGILCGSNPILRERWSHGIVECSWLKGASGAAYVAKYVSKQKPNKYVRDFFGSIICSNGLGTNDISSFEIGKVRQSIRQGVLPYYYAGGRQYSYPYSVLRKYVNRFDLMELSRIAGLSSMLDGGYFVFHRFRTDNYEMYRSYVDVWLKNVDYYKRDSMPLFVKPDGYFNIRDDEYPDYVPF